MQVVGSSEYPDTNRHRANYIRRDVVSVQAGGWVQIRFIADNPGECDIHVLSSVGNVRACCVTLYVYVPSC